MLDVYIALTGATLWRSASSNTATEVTYISTYVSLATNLLDIANAKTPEVLDRLMHPHGRSNFAHLICTVPSPREYIRMGITVVQDLMVNAQRRVWINRSIYLVN
jgi:hypothetical protein